MHDSDPGQTEHDERDIRSFYDEFLDSRMLQYRIYGNERIDVAADTILEELEPSDSVLEIGCGIGITTERIADVVADGHVWACDLNERMIAYARETVRSDRVTFFSMDVVEDIDQIDDRVPTTIDLVVLVDVVEHLSGSGFQSLIRRLEGFTSTGARILLTFPSPEYQSFLREEKPGELQPIDRVIHYDDLEEAIDGTGWRVTLWEYKDVWKTNQYVHARIEKGIEIADVERNTGFVSLARRKIAATVRRAIMLPIRRWRYGKRVLRRIDKK